MRCFKALAEAELIRGAVTRLALVMLFALIFPTNNIYAQSGRARATQGSTTGSTNSKQSTNTQDEPANEVTTNPQGEELEGDVLRVNTTLVTVPVTVKDRNGRYIPDLSRGDFHLYEDGAEQKIAYFATVDQPFTVALVIDTSNSTNFRLEDMQSAAIAFVNQLKAEDRVMVISFDDKIHVLTEPMNDRDALAKAIRRTRTGGGTRLYDAVDFVLKKKLKQIQGRKAMVLFTDGVDTESLHASYDSTLRLAEEQDAICYPVGYNTNTGFGTASGPRIPMPGGRGGIIINTPVPGLPMPGGSRGGSAEDYRRAGQYLRALADRTGGRYYNGDSMSGIAQAFQWVAEELRRQYSIGYYPKNAGTAGQRRQIKVRVNQPNLVVTARDSYIYSPMKPNQTETDKEKSTSPFAGEKYRFVARRTVGSIER